MIISADLKNTYKLDLSTVEGYTPARCDQMGRIRGNMLSAKGAYAFVVPNGGTQVLIVNIKNGAVDADYTQLSNPIAGVGLTTSCCPQPAFDTVEEINALMGGDMLAVSPWPTYDEAKCVDAEVEIVAQVNGKVRAKLSVAADIDAADAIALAKADAKISEEIAGKTIVKELYVKGRLVNIVVK